MYGHMAADTDENTWPSSIAYFRTQTDPRCNYRAISRVVCFVVVTFDDVVRLCVNTISRRPLNSNDNVAVANVHMKHKWASGISIIPSLFAHRKYVRFADIKSN